MEALGIEVKLKKHFSIVRETLSRMGTVNREDKIVNPTCYLLHKKNRYYIIHFKNLFIMDNIETDFTEEDDIRQTSITQLLEDWGLVEIINEDQLTDESVFIFILPHTKRFEYKIIHKYRIGQNTLRKRNYIPDN